MHHGAAMEDRFEILGILALAVPRISSPVFVGRAAELGALDSALHDCERGTVRAVLIGGDAGVGKSRLMSTWADRARATGWTVLFGRCLDLGETGPPFVPIVELLRGLLSSITPTERSTVVGSSRSDLGRLLPELAPGDIAESLGPSPPRSAQGHLFETVAGCLNRGSRTTSLAVVIEDLHLADESTRRFLTYLIGAQRTPGILLLGTYRTDDLHRRHPLRPFLASLSTMPEVESIELAPFDRAELAHQIRAILGADPSPEEVDSFFARTEGNAFLTEEVLAAGRGNPDAALPASLRDAILVRVSRLSGDADALLRIAAAAGTSVQAGLIAAATGLGDRELIAALREVVETNLLVPVDNGDAYRFRHALLREVVYDDIVPGERARLHRAIAGAISADRSIAGEGPEGSAAALARHWNIALEFDEALVASIEAGRSARDMLAYREATRHFERAAELWDKTPIGRTKTSFTLADVIESASECARLGGDLERATRYAEAALSVLDPATTPLRCADLLVRLSWMTNETANGHRSKELALKAVRLAPSDPPSSTRARALTTLSALLNGDGDPVGARGFLEEALTISGTVGDYWSHIELATSLIYTGQIDRGIDAARRAQGQALAAGDRGTVAVLLAEIAYDLVDVGDLVRGLAIAREAIDSTDDAGLDHADGAQARQAASEALLRLGRLDEAYEIASEALRARPEGRASYSLHTLSAEIDVARGAVASARDHLEAARVPGMTHEEERFRAYLARARTRLALTEGRPGDALAMAAATAKQLRNLSPLALTNRIGMLPLGALGLTAAADCVEVAGARRDAVAREAARAAGEAIRSSVDWVERSRREAELPQLPGLAPWAVWLEAESTRLEGRSDARSWASTAAAFDAQGEPYPAIEARYRQAEALLLRNSPRAAIREVLAGAHANAVEIGANGLIARIDILGRRAHIALRRAAPGSKGGGHVSKPELALRGYRLTLRERQVLGLLADGWSNRQIAERLFISESTAGVHVSNLLSKMELPNRVAAGIAAHRLGLTSSVTEETS
jgi:DNA-binding CsgD family transcriptional regulator